MFQVGTEWNPLQAKLKEIILQKDRFDEAVALLYRMHALVHSAAVYGSGYPTYMDETWQWLDQQTFQTMPTTKDATIAWDIWHITRIEDLTTNLLIDEGDQVLDGQWSTRLNTAFTDTGNAMTDEEILQLSRELPMDALRDYRDAVGRRTREIIGRLRPDDMRRKVSPAGLERIREEGGVTANPDSAWLLDFWGRKNVCGLFLMPVTRHQIVHLNDCAKLKEKCRRSR